MRPLPHIPVIGLIGGIGAGKSTVGEVLRELGCVVSDSDRLAREAVLDSRVADRLVERWGKRVIAPSEGGAAASPIDPPAAAAPAADRRATNSPVIDRRAVAAIVFNDPVERRWLESIVHPWIEDRRAAEFSAALPGTAALVIDAPLLLEAGLDESCDAVFFVDTPRPLRLERLRATRGWDETELARRESAQWPLERKRLKATHVIPNQGDRAALRAAVEAALDDVRGRQARGCGAPT